jgi:O-succinylbenzoic acid--CoA ligase
MPYLIGKQELVDFVNPGTFIPPFLQKAYNIINNWQNGCLEFELHTSGSTGVPKKILLERDKIEYSALLTAETFGIKSGDNLLCCLNVESVAGFMMIMRAVVNGCNLIITEPTASPLGDIEQRIDFAAFVPLQLEKILQTGFSGISKLNRMKAILAGGAPVSAALEDKIQKIQSPVFQTYSMTETYTHVAVKRLNGPFKSDKYFPLKDVNLSLDSRGCLVIQSPVTNNSILATNDLAEIYPDGSFSWLGRYDNVVNSGGVKIQIESTEEHIREILHANTINNPFFLAALPNEKLGQKLVMVIENNAEIEKIKVILKERLPKYHAPSEIFITPRIELTLSGKFDKIKTLKKLDIQ